MSEEEISDTDKEEARKAANRERQRRYRERHRDRIKENSKRWNVDIEKKRKRDKKYREANPEKYREKSRKYRENNKEKCSARDKKYRKNNREKCLQRDRDYYANHRDECVERSRNYRKNNPDKCRESTRNYQKTHKEQVRNYLRKWQGENPDKCSEYGKKQHMKNRLEALLYYSGGSMKCAICGETHYEFLSIDHINGGGNEHRRETARNIYPWLKKNNYPDGFRVLCHNCNQRLGNVKINLWRKNNRVKVLSYYSGGAPVCKCCGENHIDNLCIDHINGGGAKHKEETKGGIYRWLIKNNFPVGYRVLCHNCNQSLGAYGYCPHKVEKN